MRNCCGPFFRSRMGRWCFQGRSVVNFSSTSPASAWSDAINLFSDDLKNPFEVLVAFHHDGLDRLVVWAAAWIGDEDVSIVGHFWRVERDVDGQVVSAMPRDRPPVH